MSDERRNQETVARCVAIMVNYYNSGPRERATREMMAEIRTVAEAVGKFSLPQGDVVENILRPVEAELVVRYGHELGTRMNKHFISAFEDHETPHRITSDGSNGVAASPRFQGPGN
jgi:hypothetical protein